MRIYPMVGGLILACVAPMSLDGQEDQATVKLPQDEEAIHQELRELRTTLTEAVEAEDLDQQLTYVHENAVATWQDNTVVRGRPDLQEFLKTKGGAFQGYRQRPEADELSILYGGETAIAFGSSVPHYKILGMEFDLENRWTATLVKEDGRWLIAAYHVSANVLDNPVLQIAKQSAYWAGGIALVVGLVLGIVANVIVRKLGQRST